MDTSKGSKRVSLSVTDKTIGKFLAGINCPRSLAVWLLYQYKEHEQLVELGWNAADYETPAAARDAYLATNLLKKAKFLSLQRSPREVAITKFLEAEVACGSVNRRFRNLALDPDFRTENVALLERTRRICHRLLDGAVVGEGAVSSFCSVEWIESCKWGPGANYSLRGERTSPAHKFQTQSGITAELYCLVRDIFPLAYPLWDSHLRRIDPAWGAGVWADWKVGPKIWLPSDLPPTVNEFVTVGCENGHLDYELYRGRGYRYVNSFEKGNRVLTVAKNAKTDRVIAVEPALNSWFQLGLGEMIRRRLLRNGGIDLRQQARNQLLAFYGSYTGKLATVDFSSASDTISEEVVRTLLPSEWYRVMDASRSHFGKDPRSGEFRRYEKFSSMGNGFTFPLQSLIFTAAAIACCESLGADSQYVGVYGDDVVIPSEAFAVYAKFCAFLGFKVGPEKSFSTGYFRESCGAHYLRGVDLKPIFIEDVLESNEDKYVFANNLRRLAHRCMYYGCDRRFLNCWRYVVHQVPPEHRFFIPDGSGDGGFVGNFDEARPSTVREPVYKWRGRKVPATWVSGWQVRMAVQLPIEDEVKTAGLQLSRLLDVDRRHCSAGEVPDIYSPDISGGGNRVPRRRATRTTVKWVDVPRKWHDFGSWL